eukprot:998824-Rhodomonas_salina.1
MPILAKHLFLHDDRACIDAHCKQNGKSSMLIQKQSDAGNRSASSQYKSITRFSRLHARLPALTSRWVTACDLAWPVITSQCPKQNRQPTLDFCPCAMLWVANPLTFTTRATGSREKAQVGVPQGAGGDPGQDGKGVGVLPLSFPPL